MGEGGDILHHFDIDFVVVVVMMMMMNIIVKQIFLGTRLGTSASIQHFVC